MTTQHRYRRFRGSSHKTRAGFKQLTMVLPDSTVSEVNALAKSRDASVTSFIRELIEIALAELEGQGEICRL